MRQVKIEGQAVFEGIMFRNKDKCALAVRKPNKDIVLEVSKFKGFSEKSDFFKYPFIRGIVSFIEFLYLGIKMFSHSTTFYEDESVNKDNELRQILIVVATISLAIAVFFALPYGLSLAFKNITSSDVALTLIEGVIRLFLLLIYIFAISLVPDIKRIYMYNGAEHKSINCIESGLPLTPKNVKRMSRLNLRSGTSFILDVVFLSIILFMFIRFDNLLLRLIFRIILVPAIAAIVYEFMRITAESENLFFIILSIPGLLLQEFTAREPDDEMIEVAISSIEAVFDWESFISTSRLYKRNKPLKQVTRTVSPDKASDDRKPYGILTENEPTEKIKNEKVPMRTSLKENKVIKEVQNKDTIVKRETLKEDLERERLENESTLNKSTVNKDTLNEAFVKREIIKRRIQANQYVPTDKKVVPLELEEKDDILDALDHFFDVRKDEE